MATQVEPWLRNTHTGLDALRRQVIHALELTEEDCARWCTGLSADELNARPYGLPSVGFQMRHIVRSLDRLLSYAEGRALTPEQHAALQSEHLDGEREAVLSEFVDGMRRAKERVLASVPTDDETVRYVGRDRLPTTAGALLIHCAEHTQRHTGQMVTTAKLLLAMRVGK